MKRREFVAALSVAPALVGLTRKSPRAITGGFVDDGGAAGHRLRDGNPALKDDLSNVLKAGLKGVLKDAVIIGGGIAGLSAAWELQRRGMTDFVLLEMEKDAGGNSRFGENEITAYPWAAHYVPIPDAGATLVRELFEELGVLRNGAWEERYLTFSPHERLFLHGQWHEGIEPEYALGLAAQDQFRRFDEEIARQRATGQFTVPMARGVRADSPLDRTTMADWLAQRGLDAPELRWYVDYACRDDYGALSRDVSAWAGIHYFASRPHAEEGDEGEGEGMLTWPEGNGWIARRLASRVQSRIATATPALRIERDRSGRWTIQTPSGAYVARNVIWAAPTFVAPYVIGELAPMRPSVARDMVYSPWLTANLTLERWPRERGRGAPPSWDNVFYDSPALGYVVATHQSLATRADRTVWTYYWALAEHAPAVGRAMLQQRPWREWTDLILADLERAHPDIRDCVSRVDIMRMGHAMVRPTVGSLQHGARVRQLERPGLYFANSDISGLSLFEEAQYRGVMAARKALSR